MDKQSHFLSCFIPTLIVGIVSLPIAIAFSIGLAIGKETGDYMNYGKDMKLLEFLRLAIADLLADGIGILIAFIIINLIK